MQDLVGIDKFAVTVQVIDSRQYLLIEPVLNLEITGKGRYNKIFELLIQLFDGASLSKGEIFIVGIDTIILGNYVLIVINHSG